MKKLLLFFTFLSAIALWTHADVVAFYATGASYSGAAGEKVTVPDATNAKIDAKGNDVSISISSGTSGSGGDGLIRWFSGQTLTVTPNEGVTIEKIEVKCSTATYSKVTTTPAFS